MFIYYLWILGKIWSLDARDLIQWDQCTHPFSLAFSGQTADNDHFNSVSIKNDVFISMWEAFSSMFFPLSVASDQILEKHWIFCCCFITKVHYYCTATITDTSELYYLLVIALWRSFWSNIYNQCALKVQVILI